MQTNTISQTINSLAKFEKSDDLALAKMWPILTYFLYFGRDVNHCFRMFLAISHKMKKRTCQHLVALSVPSVCVRETCPR